MNEDVIRGLFVLGGAVTGAILNGIFNRINAKKNKTIKKLSIKYAQPTLLINVSSGIQKGLVKISFKGTAVDLLYQNEITILNSGNDIIERITVYFELASQNSKLINAEIARVNFNLAWGDIVVGPTSERGGSIEIAYLNTRDEIKLIILTDGFSELEFSHRQPNVVTEVMQQQNLQLMSKDFMSNENRRKGRPC